MASRIFDISIIGGGPIGLFAAGAAGEMGAFCNIIESRLHLGGIMLSAYPDKDVYNFPGVQVIKGRDLISDLIQKAKNFGMIARLGEYVNNIKSGSKNTVIIKSNKGEYLSSTVLIAAGLKAQYSPLTELIQVEGWNGSGIYEGWPTAEAIAGRKIAVICGSKGIPEIPEEIVPISTNFVWIFEKSSNNVSASNLKGEIVGHPWAMAKISGQKTADCILLKNEISGEERSIQVDGIISLLDLQPRQTLYSNFGIEMLGQDIKVDQRMQTSLKRVYAVGDIAYYPGKIKLLSTGIYEARIAVKNALKVI